MLRTAALRFESLATFALGVNLITYFNAVMHYNIADAANVLTNFVGTVYILSTAVAVFADTYVGRFIATAVSAFVDFLVRIMNSSYIFVHSAKTKARGSGSPIIIITVSVRDLHC